MDIRRALLVFLVAVTLPLSSTPASAKPACNLPLPEAFKTVAPSVVRIFSVSIDSFRLTQRVEMETGAGIIFDDKGHIVTNAHVVYGAKQLLVSIDEQSMYPAEIVGADLISDLAVIKITDGESLQLPPARFGNSQTLEIGEDVFAVGYPLEMSKTVSRGIVSGLNRQVPMTALSWLTPMIQTDAAVNPGNSGGPLVDLCGTVVGITTLTGRKAENVAFAIPAATVNEIVPQLIAKGHIVRAWHGINGKIVPDLFVAFLEMPPGLLVETVEPGSPAEKIGLHSGLLPIVIGTEEYLVGGDVITAVNGKPLTALTDVAQIARSLKVGDKISVTYWRDGEEKTIDVVLPERPVLTGDLIAIGRTGDQSKDQ
jgi:serine protease Do